MATRVPNVPGANLAIPLPRPNARKWRQLRNTAVLTASDTSFLINLDHPRAKLPREVTRRHCRHQRLQNLEKFMELIVRQFSHDCDLEVVRCQRRLAGIDEVATILDGRVKRVEAECFRNADRQNRGGFTPR